MPSIQPWKVSVIILSLLMKKLRLRDFIKIAEPGLKPKLIMPSLCPFHNTNIIFQISRGKMSGLAKKGSNISKLSWKIPEWILATGPHFGNHYSNAVSRISFHHSFPITVPAESPKRLNTSKVTLLTSKEQESKITQETMLLKNLSESICFKMGSKEKNGQDINSTKKFYFPNKYMKK